MNIWFLKASETGAILTQTQIVSQTSLHWFPINAGGRVPKTNFFQIQFFFHQKF